MGKKNKSNKFVNSPNKDIASEIHRGCFGYKDMNKLSCGKKIEERVYTTYNGVFKIIKEWVLLDEQGFLDFVKKMNIDENH